MKESEYYAGKIRLFPKGIIDPSQEKNLSIQERCNKFKEDIKDMREKSSVTPDTHVFRNFFEDNDKDIFQAIHRDIQKKIDKIKESEQLLSNATKSLIDVCVVSAVQHKGLDNQIGNVTQLSGKKKHLEGYLNAYNKFLQDIDKNDSVYFIDTYKQDNIEIHRYGIRNTAIVLQQVDQTKLGIGNKHSVQGSQKSNKSDEVLLHPLEIYLIKKAIVCNENVILLDMFVRDDVTGAVMFEKDTNIPAIHTVVLYKNVPADHKQIILIIDPNNSDSSRHLSGEILQQIVNTDPSNQVEFSTLNRPLRIYEPEKDKTGPESFQYRDCIDISLKLALRFKCLNNNPKIAFITDNKLGQNKVFDNDDADSILQQIANNARMNNSIPLQLIDETKFCNIPLNADSG